MKRDELKYEATLEKEYNCEVVSYVFGDGPAKIDCGFTWPGPVIVVRG